MGKGKKELQGEIDALAIQLAEALELTVDEVTKQLTAQVEALTAEVESVAAGFAELTTEKSELSAMIETLAEEKAEMSVKITTLAEENDELLEALESERITALTNQVDDLTGQVADLKIAQPAAVNVAKVKGFVLAVDDPFGKGVLRTYLAISKNPSSQSPSLPFVLPFSDAKATAIALDDYIVRSAGGCDKKREAAARAAKKQL